MSKQLDSNPSTLEPTDETEAFSDAFSAARSEPSNEGHWDAVDEHARRVDAPEDAEALYLEVLEQDLDKPTLGLLGQRAVNFLEEWYEDTDRSIAILNKLLRKDWENSWALEKLSLLLTLAERWDDLLGTYDEALAAADTASQKAGLLEEAARIAKDFAGQAQRASAYLKELLLLKPDDDKLSASLERRLEQQERYADLVDVWSARLAVVDEPSELLLRTRIAETQLSQLKNAQASLHSVKELLARGIGETDACRLLEGITESAAADIHARREALDILRQRYAKLERPLDVIRALERALDLAPDDDARILTNQRLVTWLLQADRQSDALAAAARWLRLSPGAEDALEQLRALASATGQHSRFADALVQAAETTGSTDLRVRLLLEAAESLQEQAKEADAACALFGRVLDDSEANTDGKLRAARRLTSILTLDAQRGQRLDVLEKYAALEPDAAIRMELLAEAARLSEGFGDDERALKLWDARLLLEPGDAQAVDAKIALLDRVKRFPELRATLLVRYGTQRGSASQRADLVRIAGLDEHELGDRSAAIATWRQVEEVFEPNAETVDSLCRLLHAEQHWDDLVALLERAIKQESDATRKTTHYGDLGRVCAEQRGELTRAVKAYESALAIDPRYELARDGLQRLLDEESVRYMAAETLAGAYEAADEWQLLLDIAETRLNAEPNPTSRQAILLQAAELLEQKADNSPEALKYVERAFSIHPLAQIEERMVSLAESTNNWETAVSGYQRALRHCDDLARTTELLYEQGRTLEIHLRSYDGALGAYVRILELEPEHGRAACAAVRSAGHLGQWSSVGWAILRSAAAAKALSPELLDEFERSAALHDAWVAALAALREAIDISADPNNTAGLEPLTPRTSHDVKFQLARWYAEQVSDPLNAETVLAEAVTEHKSEPSLRMLCGLRRQAPGRPLVASLLELAEVVDEPLSSFAEASRVAQDVVADPELSTPILHRTLELADAKLSEGPTEDLQATATWCVQQLVAVYSSSERHAKALEVLEHSSTMNIGSELQLDFRHQAAELAAGPLANPTRAIALCKQVLERDPARSSTIGLLAGLYEAENQLPELLELRQHELKLKPSLERRLELRLDVARVLGALNKPQGQQLERLTANLEEAPGHEATLEALSGLYTELGQFDKLYKLLSAQAERLVDAKDEPRAAALYARAGELAEQSLESAAAALKAYGLSAALAPSVVVLDRLAALNEDREEFPTAVKWLDQRLELTPSDDLEAKRTTLVRLGKALACAGHSERAISELSQGLASDEAAEEVRELLATLHEERRQWAELANVLASGVPFAKHQETRMRYLTRAAEIRWHKLGDVAAASPLLADALDLDPDDKQLKLELAEAWRLEKRYDESKSLLDALLTEFGRRRTPERATVHFQLAQIARAQSQLDQALSQLDAASTIQRSDPLILKTLGDVARENGELDRAERAYRALLLLVSRGDASVASRSDIGSSSILFELYRLATDKDDTERARDLLESALEAADENPVEARRLEKALAQAGKWELLLEAVARRASAAESTDEQLEIGKLRARALKELGRYDAAYTLCADLLPDVPEDEELFNLTSELATLSSNTDMLRALVARVAAAQETKAPELACQLWLQLGAAVEADGAMQLAAEYYQAAQRTGRKPKASFEALAHVLETLGDRDALISALNRLLETDEGALGQKYVVAARYRLASLALQEPSRAEAGVQFLAEALQVAPDWQQAYELLVSSAASVRDSELAAELLMHAAERLGSPEHQLEAALLIARTPFSTLEQLETACRHARHLERGDDELTLLEAAVALGKQAGDRGQARWALSRLSARRIERGEYQPAASLLEACVADAEGDARIEYATQLAELQRTQLGSPMLAATTYEKLAAEFPEDPRAWQPLLQIYREHDAREPLEACLARAEAHVVDESERLLLQLERLRLMIEGGNYDTAERALRTLMARRPDSAEVGDLLIELLEKTERPAAIRSLLQERLEYAAANQLDELVVACALRLGAMLEQDNDVPGAVDVYRNARNSVSGDRLLLSALLRLVPEGEQHERADLLESLLPTESPEAVEQVALKLAGLRTELNDETGMERALELGFKLNPKSAELRDRLEQWYLDREDWLPLAELMTLDAETLPESAEALLRFQQAAQIYDDKLGDAVSAANVLKLALKRAPTSPQVLELFAQYQLTAGAGELALDAITDALVHDDISDESRALLHHLRAAVRARSDEHSLTAVARAVADLDRARELGGQELDDDLQALLLRQRELAEMEGNADMERGLVVRLADFMLERELANEARDVLGHWVKRHAEDKESAVRWAKLSMDLSHWHDAMAAYRLLFGLTTGDQRREAAIHFAEACEHAGVPMTARDILLEARREFALDTELQERVFRMYDTAGAQAELARILLDEAQEASDSDVRYALFANAGALLLRSQEPSELGVEAFKEALALRADDHAALVGLANSYTRVGQIAEACSLLEEAIKLHGKRRSPELSELQHAMANVADAAGDDEGRFAWLDAALQSDRRNGAVASELAAFAMERGEYDAALLALQRIVGMREDCPMSRAEAYLRQGMIAQERGDKKKALLLAKRALSMDADYEPAVQFLEQLGRV